MYGIVNPNCGLDFGFSTLYPIGKVSGWVGNVSFLFRCGKSIICGVANG